MGSKGQSTQQATSTYTPSANVAAAGNQALSMAQGAASQPFQLPVAPVAGFTPLQQQAFQQTQQEQGMAQPYYNQAQNYFQQSAAPITGQQVGNYMNPYAGYVMGNLAEQQGQQMQDLTGKATQAAGGVGADRIGVAQGELARQQNLASGQTLSGIYGNALSAAQQNAQMQQAAGYGIGQLGGSAQNAAMQGTQALYGMGSQQQQLAQAQMNAPYQNQLAQIAYPYQNAQYLAGITSNLAGALGGTTGSNQINTPAQPSIYSQLAGLGTGLAGAYGAYSGLSGGSGGGFVGNSSVGGAPLSGYSGVTPQNAASGGRIEGFAAGGASTDSTDAPWMTADPTIPNIQMHPSQIQQPKLPSAPASTSSDNIGSDLGSIAKTAATILPLFLSRGGSAYPHYADGGDTVGEGGNTAANYSPDFNSRWEDAATMGEVDRPRFVKGQTFGEMPRAVALAHYARQNGVPTPPPGYEEPPQIVPAAYRMPDVKADGSPIAPPEAMRPDDTSAEAGPRYNVGMVADTGDTPTKLTVRPTAASPYAGMRELSPAAADTAEHNAAAMKDTKYNVPYGDIDPTNDTSRQFAKSPWLALMNAGFGMMAGTSPWAGINIGKGLQEGVKTLEGQRKSLESEEAVNQKAKQLAQTADAELRKYTQLTPAEAMRGEQAQSTLEASNLQKLYEDPMDGTVLYKNKATGKLEKYGRGADGSVGPVPLTAADGAKAAAATATAGSKGPLTANTSISPPGGVVAADDPAKMIDRPQEIKADRNPEIYQYIGGKDQASRGRMASNVEKKMWDTAAAAADKVQGRAMDMKRDLDTISAYVNKNSNGLAEKALQFAIKPGPGAENGVNIANFISKFGKGLPPEVLAAATSLQKNSTLAGFAGIVGEGLSAREAMPIIKASMGAVANINLPEASNRALIASAYEIAQRSKDKAAFLSDYMLKNSGQSDNWQAEFEKSHPIGSYIARAVISALPQEARVHLGQNTQQLRQFRDEYMAAEKSGNTEAINSAKAKYTQARNEFNVRYGGTADYFAFGRMM